MLARGLGNASVLNTRGTRTLASAAQQAQMKMLLETIIQFDSPFGGGFDKVNPAARRFRFELQGSIGRTLIQTEAAVNALVELGKIKSRHPSGVGRRYFVVRRFQLRSSCCFEFRVYGFEFSNRNPKHATRNTQPETRFYIPSPSNRFPNPPRMLPSSFLPLPP